MDQVGAESAEKRMSLSDFQFIKVLGRGTFGKVVLCREHASQVWRRRLFCVQINHLLAVVMNPWIQVKILFLQPAADLP